METYGWLLLIGVVFALLLMRPWELNLGENNRDSDSVGWFDAWGNGDGGMWD